MFDIILFAVLMLLTLCSVVLNIGIERRIDIDRDIMVLEVLSDMY